MRTRQSCNAARLGTMALLIFLQPARCGVPTVAVEAAQFPPAITIFEGKTAQGYPYMSGGIGSGEREAMEERAKGYNVKLVFAARDGSFISAVSIEIVTVKGAEVVSLTTDGPWFYIQLPQGSYSVKAGFKGETKEIKVLRVAREKRVQQSLIWDAAQR